MNEKENDIIRQRSGKDRLKQFQWLLEMPVPSDMEKEISYSPPYGDVTELNTCRKIMDSVGNDTLKEIGRDAIDLLDTSVAVYEENGDYAFGMFSSGWCRLMDAASRDLCKTDDNKDALSCGKWLCHENCWNDSARAAMESGNSRDIRCVGGINLYAEPIYAGGKIVGAINIGYGDPPQDEKKLRELAERFGVDLEKLRQAAGSYKSRPDFMVSHAKKRLKSWAKLIGEIVEKTEAQEKLIKSEKRYRGLFEESPISLWEEDFSNVKAYIDGLRESGVKDISAYFESNPDELARCAAMVNIVYVNRATMNLYGCENMEEFRSGLVNFFSEESYDVFKEEIVALFNGEMKFEAETVTKTLKGKKINIIIRWSVAPGYEETFSKVFVSIMDITEMKRKEAELTETVMRKNEAIRAGNVGLWDWDLVTNKVKYSAEWKMQIGYEDYEISDDFKEWRSRVHPEDLEATIEKVQRSIRELRQNHEVEFRFRHKDGSYRWIMAQASISKDGKTGLPARMLGSHIDITEQKRIESELKKSEALYREAQHIAGIGHWELDSPDGTPVWSEEIFHIFGLDPEKSEPSFAAHAGIIHEKDWPVLENSIQTLNHDGTPFDIEFRILRSNGAVRWMHAKGSADKDKAGRVIRMFGTAQDITDQKKTRDNLIRLKAQLSNAMEIANLAHWEYDVEDDLFTFNDQFYRIFRTTADDVGGYIMSPEEYAARFVHPDDVDFVMKAVQKPGETTGPLFGRQLEHRILYSDATTGHMSIRHVVIRDPHGKPVKIFGVNQDITHLKKMEDEILKKQKLGSLGLFAGGIAHDYNNILTTIIGNVALAKAQIAHDDEMFEILTDVETASARAQAITRQLLIFSKGGEPVKEVTSMEELIKESALIALRGSKTRVELSIDKGLWEAEVDPGQINQVINNIVINATQAMPEGGVILIKAENLTMNEISDIPLKPGRYIGISFKDRGEGIEEKYLSRIFDPYFTTRHGSIGLGLAAAYSIINRHEGYISVDSKPGQGTTFSVSPCLREGETCKTGRQRNHGKRQNTGYG